MPQLPLRKSAQNVSVLQPPPNLGRHKPNAGCLKGLHMTAIIYLKNGKVEVVEGLGRVDWGEYNVDFELSMGWWNEGKEDKHIHPSEIVKVELVP